MVFGFKLPKFFGNSQSSQNVIVIPSVLSDINKAKNLRDLANSLGKLANEGSKERSSFDAWIQIVDSSISDEKSKFVSDAISTLETSLVHSEKLLAELKKITIDIARAFVLENEAEFNIKKGIQNAPQSAELISKLRELDSLKLEFSFIKLSSYLPAMSIQIESDMSKNMRNIIIESQSLREKGANIVRGMTQLEHYLNGFKAISNNLNPKKAKLDVHTELNKPTQLEKRGEFY